MSLGVLRAGGRGEARAGMEGKGGEARAGVEERRAKQGERLENLWLRGPQHWLSGTKARQMCGIRG